MEASQMSTVLKWIWTCISAWKSSLVLNLIYFQIHDQMIECWNIFAFVLSYFICISHDPKVLILYLKLKTITKNKLLKKKTVLPDKLWNPASFKRDSTDSEEKNQFLLFPCMYQEEIKLCDVCRQVVTGWPVMFM